MVSSFHRVFLHIVLLLQALPLSSSSEFDPYQLNGGLVAAVAGRDFCLVAVDTRLIGKTGYDILDRQHLQSRLWTATTPIQTIPTTTTTTTTTTTGTTSSNNLNKYKNRNTQNKQDSILPPFGADGSLRFPHPPATAATTTTTQATKQLDEWESTFGYSESLFAAPPVLIGSTGCQADCEFLKRYMRFEVRRSHRFGEVLSVGVGGNTKEISTSTSLYKNNNYQRRSGRPSRTTTTTTTPTSSIAVLLSQLLYQRRGFPWYAFCVVAGLAHHDDQQCGAGQVFVYDAIGSYEAVAVATAGTGRELLQPILDRSFSVHVPKKTSLSSSSWNNHKNDDSDEINSRPDDDIITRRPACPPCIQQSPQEAAEILVQAFRAVSERQATVGDHVVLCCIQRNSEREDLNKDGHSSLPIRLWVQSSPLKKH